MLARSTTLAVTLAALALAAGPAMGTTITDPWNASNASDEENLYEIINTLYGTTYGFSLNSSADILAALVSADEVFTGLAGSELLAKVKYAGNNPQRMGIYAEDSTNDADKVGLLEVYGGYPGGYAGDLTGSLSAEIPVAPDPFGFYLTSGGLTWYSQESLNADGMEDHMVLIDLGHWNAALANKYLIGWEDRSFDKALGPLTDSDYQDLVVEFAVVPEPATMALLGLGIAGLAVRQARRKKQD